MSIVGIGTETFLLLSGIKPTQEVRLSDGVFLQSADTSHLDFKTTLAALTGPLDIAAAAGFIHKITAQLRITAESPEKLAARAWNAQWDVILLAALFGTEIGFNLQSDVSAEKIGRDSILRATNNAMYGLASNNVYELSNEDVQWIDKHFSRGQDLLDNDTFQTAVHCAASFAWHTMPRARLAVIWAGLEGLFGASTEIRFKISVYLARFLHPGDESERVRVFDEVKKLYNVRSAAVHGSKLKENAAEAVQVSAEYLRKVIRKCVEEDSLPNTSLLVP